MTIVHQFESRLSNEPLSTTELTASERVALARVADLAFGLGLSSVDTSSIQPEITKLEPKESMAIPPRRIRLPSMKLDQFRIQQATSQHDEVVSPDVPLSAE